MRTMPLPDRPVVHDYGWNFTQANHYIHLFPAVIRLNEAVRAEAVLEGGQSTCFFHSKLPATALCDVSGRLICDLCKTEWNGKTVSFEALQSLLADDVAVKQERRCTKWDDIALSLVIFPVLFGPIVVVTAPVALGICVVKWRAGPTSLLRRSRWRYVVAALLAIFEIGFGGLLVAAMFFGVEF
ncbi:Unannotated [Lentimonas sp. CC19]|nr:Unannotated [Lentimonas sp. CC4]CAA6684690.1 Unannotated [Lentimonas sp. CC6]CAA6694111.1 Unannotated [Lentimonas sp. CC19]CAA6694390.1 Unannotated [Lentimonas sp. CC10]CAA7070344.1 Unannotated [Lentimonas sp. CC11]CAA7170986.1 Unannotated [Lentimonas sp. CC21]CAA7182267.1 Unannotated [Lentimonas sp. CC8]